MNKKPKKSLSQRISESFDIPVDALSKVSTAEARGNSEVCFGGCEVLVSYTETEAVLCLCDGLVSVLGEGLVLRSFSGGRIAVCGKIDCIRYGARSEDKNDR